MDDPDEIYAAPAEAVQAVGISAIRKAFESAKAPPPVAKKPPPRVAPKPGNSNKPVAPFQQSSGSGAAPSLPTKYSKGQSNSSHGGGIAGRASVFGGPRTSKIPTSAANGQIEDAPPPVMPKKSSSLYSQPLKTSVSDDGTDARGSTPPPPISPKSISDRDSVPPPVSPKNMGGQDSMPSPVSPKQTDSDTPSMIAPMILSVCGSSASGRGTSPPLPPPPAEDPEEIYDDIDGGVFPDPPPAPFNHSEPPPRPAKQRRSPPPLPPHENGSPSSASDAAVLELPTGQYRMREVRKPADPAPKKPGLPPGAINIELRNTSAASKARRLPSIPPGDEGGKAPVPVVEEDDEWYDDVAEMMAKSRPHDAVDTRPRDAVETRSRDAVETRPRDPVETRDRDSHRFSRIKSYTEEEEQAEVGDL